MRARHKRELKLRLSYCQEHQLSKSSKSPQLQTLISGSNIARFALMLQLLNASDQLIKLLNFFWNCTWGCLRVFKLVLLLIPKQDIPERCASIRREVCLYSKGSVRLFKEMCPYPHPKNNDKNLFIIYHLSSISYFSSSLEQIVFKEIVFHCFKKRSGWGIWLKKSILIK